MNEFDNILDCFEKDFIEVTARNTGFTQRKSPINGFNFLLTFTLGNIASESPTLNQLVSYLNNSFDIDVSSQALDQRVNEKASLFLKECLEKVIKLVSDSKKNELVIQSQFQHIFIIDSTNIKLHPDLREHFKGCGGDASSSSLRIQFIYDYLSSQVDIIIGDVKTADSTTLNNIIKQKRLNIKGSALFLFDLGYFYKSTFKLIDEMENCYFISKLKHTVLLQNETGKNYKIYEALKARKESYDFQAYFDKLKFRVVAKKCDKECIDKRNKYYKKNRNTRDKKQSNNYKLYSSYFLYITNIGKGCSFEYIYTHYRVRWQVELMFKSWKSILKIGFNNSAKLDRVLCNVYGKLIIAVLTNDMVNQSAEKRKVNLSYFKCLQHIKASVNSWTTALKKNIKHHIRYLKNTVNIFVRRCKKSNQKDKTNIELLLNQINEGNILEKC